MSRITNDDATPTSEDRRCAGQAEYSRCTFRAEVWPEPRRGYCGWHERVKHDARANTFEELERWIKTLTDAKYCDRWTHFTPAQLWDGMTGDRGAQAHACGALDCPHRVEEPSMLTTREHIEAFRAIVSRPDTVFTRPSEAPSDHEAKIREQAMALLRVGKRNA